MTTKKRQSIEFRDDLSEQKILGLLAAISGNAVVLWKGHAVSTLLRSAFVSGLTFEDNNDYNYILMTVRHDRFISRITVKYLEQIKD